MSVDLSKYEIVGFVDEKISKLVNIEYTGNIYAAPGVIKHIIKRHKEEIEQWKIFVQLYKEVFTKISWYQTKLFEVKVFKYNKEEMNYGRAIFNRLHSKLIKKAEEDLNKKIFNKM